MNDQRNRRKVQEHTKKLKVNIINPLREGKRLLVLDIDYSGCSVTLQAHRRPRRRLMTPFSDSGHEAADVWRAPATRVRAPWAARILGGCVPALRHLHLVCMPPHSEQAWVMN